MDEKSPLQSKKFLAYLLAEATWKIVLVVTLWTAKDVLLAREDIAGAGAGLWSFMFSIVLVAGFIEAAFIGGVAVLDKYVRIARIAAGHDDPLPQAPPEPVTLTPTPGALPDLGTSPDP